MKLFLKLSSALIIFLFIANSCTESTINPMEDGLNVYSFYGFLNVGDSVHYVRIRDLSEPILSEKSDFNGVVTFEDLQTNEILTLSDTIVNYNGNYTHNFKIPKKIAADGAYLLKAVNPEGIEVTSIATTPEITEAEFIPNESIYCESVVTLKFKNVMPQERISFDIEVQHAGQLHSKEIDIFSDQFKYDATQNETTIMLAPRNLLVEIFTPYVPDNPFFDLRLLYPTVGCHQLDTPEIKINYTHFSPEWSIGKPNRFSPIDFESGVVTNGFGFFGGINTGSFTIEIESY